MNEVKIFVRKQVFNAIEKRWSECFELECDNLLPNYYRGFGMDDSLYCSIFNYARDKYCKERERTTGKGDHVQWYRDLYIFYNLYASSKKDAKTMFKFVCDFGVIPFLFGMIMIVWDKINYFLEKEQDL